MAIGGKRRNNDSNKSENLKQARLASCKSLLFSEAKEAPRKLTLKERQSLTITLGRIMELLDASTNADKTNIITNNGETESIVYQSWLNNLSKTLKDKEENFTRALRKKFPSEKNASEFIGLITSLGPLGGFATSLFQRNMPSSLQETHNRDVSQRALADLYDYLKQTPELSLFLSENLEVLRELYQQWENDCKGIRSNVSSSLASSFPASASLPRSLETEPAKELSDDSLYAGSSDDSDSEITTTENDQSTQQANVETLHKKEHSPFNLGIYITTYLNDRFKDLEDSAEITFLNSDIVRGNLLNLDNEIYIYINTDVGQSDRTQKAFSITYPKNIYNTYRQSITDAINQISKTGPIHQNTRPIHDSKQVKKITDKFHLNLTSYNTLKQTFNHIVLKNRFEADQQAATAAAPSPSV